MTNRISLLATTAIVAIASPALADVTAQDVWTNWKDLSASVGQTVSAESEDMSGDTLTVSGVSITQSGEISVDGTIDEVVFTENGDGTVTITMSPSYTMTMTTEIDGEAQESPLTVEQSNLSMLASGDPDSFDYAIAADAITVSMEPPAEDDGLENGLVVFGLMDIEGTYETESSDLTEFAGNLLAGGLSVSVTGNDPDSGAPFAMRVEAADLVIESTAALPEMDSEEMSEMIAAGFDTATTVAHGEATFSVSVEGDEAFNLTGAASSGGFDLGISGDGLRYGITNTGLSLSASGSEIPFPEVSADMEELTFAFDLPVEATDEPAPFAALLNLTGLTISDMIWGVFDPAGQLPRDPATLVLDLSGTARLYDNLFADTSMSGDEAPGEVDSLDLNNLTLTLGGAELTGTGGFTFDNSDTETFDGMPAPDGRINLSLTGGMTLLGTLVEMGFVPQDQAMMVRMMAGMFAVPGEGEDTLTSTIEVQPDGSIFANGQQLQ